jgi:hypothetical protein
MSHLPSRPKRSFLSGVNLLRSSVSHASFISWLALEVFTKHSDKIAGLGAGVVEKPLLAAAVVTWGAGLPLRRHLAAYGNPQAEDIPDNDLAS